MILFASTVDLTGDAGQSTATRAVFLSLRRLAEDREIHLIAPDPQRPRELSEVPTEHIHLLPPKRNRSWIWSARGQLHMGFHLLRLFRRGDVEAVIGRLSASILTAPVMSRMFGVPYLLLARGLGPRFPVPGVQRLNARMATLIYAAFPEVREKLSAFRPDDAASIRVIPNAADPEQFRPLPLRESRARTLDDVGVDEDDFLVGFAGRMEIHHCLDVLIEAVALLRREEGGRVKLLLMGEGPVRPELRELAAERGVADDVIFTGWVPQASVVPRIAACDALYGVRSPERPGSPIKIYEYLAAARPAIVRAGEEFRFVEEIGAGVAVEEISPVTVAEAIETLQEAGAGRRREMGEAGRAYVAEHHTWDRFAERILEDVDALAAGGAPAAEGEQAGAR